MRKALNIERILSDMHDLAVSVASGNERIVSARFDKDDDLIICTTDEKSDHEWTIGFGEDGEDEN